MFVSVPITVQTSFRIFLQTLIMVDGIMAAICRSRLLKMATEIKKKRHISLQLS